MINSKNILRFLTFFNLIIVANSGFAFAVNCPSEINTSQKLLHSFANWREVNIPVPHYLSQIALYDGKPEELAALKPDSQDNKKAVWHFRPGSVNYVVCHYNGTSVQLTMALPKTVTTCTLWYNESIRNAGGEAIPRQVICLP